MDELTQRRRLVFTIVSWATLVTTVLVILGGTVVRATGSGAGCGDTWPKCGDQFIPTNVGVETLIEFYHRASSALVSIPILLVVVLAYWFFPRRHVVRKAALASGVLLVIEGLLGAALVIFGWVDADVSVGRMVVVPLHLTNTFLLLAAIAAAAWWGSGNPAPTEPRDRSMVRWLAGGAAVIVVLGATGALNAIADTVFPSESVTGSLEEKFGSTAPLLSNLRIIHPILAVVGGIFIAWIAARRAQGASLMTKRLASAVSIIVLSQFFIGIANIFFLTPLSLQVLHLMVADILWIVYVLFSMSLLGDDVPAMSQESVSV